MIGLARYRQVVRLDEPVAIEPATDWLARIDSVLDHLGTRLHHQASPDQQLAALRAALAPLEPGVLSDEVINDIEAIAAAVAATRPVVDPLDLPLVAAPAYSAAHAVSLFVGDITTLGTDAIVNAANAEMLGCRLPNHPCIDNAIHSAAGPRLRDDCAAFMAIQGEPEPVGSAKITRGHALTASYVLHTVGPRLVPGATPSSEERTQLAACYRACLDLAAEVKAISTLAFCGISTGVFAFPSEQAAPIALTTIADWLRDHPDRFARIVIDCFSDSDADVYEAALAAW